MSQPVQASIAVYPLQQQGWEGVDRAVAALRAAGLPLEFGTMRYVCSRAMARSRLWRRP
jgi:hypothetical protein